MLRLDKHLRPLPSSQASRFPPSSWSEEEDLLRLSQSVHCLLQLAHLSSMSPLSRPQSPKSTAWTGHSRWTSSPISRLTHCEPRLIQPSRRSLPAQASRAALPRASSSPSGWLLEASTGLPSIPPTQHHRLYLQDSQNTPLGPIPLVSSSWTCFPSTVHQTRTSPPRTLHPALQSRHVDQSAESWTRTTRMTSRALAKQPRLPTALLETTASRAIRLLDVAAKQRPSPTPGYLATTRLAQQQRRRPSPVATSQRPSPLLANSAQPPSQQTLPTTTMARMEAARMLKQAMAPL